MRVKYFIIIFAIIAVSATALVRDFYTYAQSDTVQNAGAIAYAPKMQSIDMWIAEALSLGDDIARGADLAIKKKTKRFNEVVSILIVIGNAYPQYQTYYRDVLLNDTSTKKKVLIASILAALNDNYLPDILIKLLDDRNPANRAAAILYYQDMRDKDAVPKLEEIAKDDPDIRIKIMAADALRTIRAQREGGEDMAG